MKTTGSNKKREVSDGEDDQRPQAKRIKKEDSSEDDEDSVATVKTDEQIVKDLLMRDMEGDESEAAAVLNELKSLFDGDKPEQQKRTYADLAVKLGAPVTILKAMRKHNTSLVQQRGLWTLGLIADRATAEAKSTMASLDTIETAIATMKSFTNIPWVQQYGTFFLSVMCKIEALSTRIVNHPDGLYVIVDSLKSYPEISEVQRWGCIVLRNISEHKIEGHKDLIIKAGGLVALSNARTNYMGNERVAQAAEEAMKNLLR